MFDFLKYFQQNLMESFVPQVSVQVLGVQKVA